MVYGCGAKTIKCLVFFFNLLAFVAGLGLLITCIVAYTDSTMRQHILGKIVENGMAIPKLNSISTILIIGMVVGCILILLGFLGCCGACTENPCLLITFCIIMIIIILVQVSIAIAVLAYRGEVQKGFEDAIDEADTRARGSSPGREPACNWFHDLEIHVHCCGGFGSVDKFNCNDRIQCSQDSEGRACREEVWKAFWSHAKAFGLIGIIFVLLEIAAIVFACLLWWAMKNGERLYERV